jgi:hypothetical protein
LEDNSRFWVWQGLAQMLACFRRTQESEANLPDSDVVLGCAELALARLENVPSELPGNLPEGDVWSGYRETSWEHALRLADEVFTWPPAVDDQGLQSRFLEVIKAAFSTENPMMQLICATTIRPFHWFLTDERRQLHYELVWNKPKHASVLSWSLSIARFYPDTDRAKIFRLLLDRGDLTDPSHLAGSLGKQVGVGSMHVFVNGLRSAVAEIARNTITSPDSFPLLQDASNRSEFLRGLIFGMKEQAKLVSSLYPQLAADYGDWSLSVWRIMRAHRKKRDESEGVVLFAMHWSEKKEGQGDRTHLKLWWQHLQPLFSAVIREGGRPDCFTLLFQLRAGEYNDLSTPEELLGLIEGFVERIRTGALAGAMDLKQQEPADEDYHSWRECAEHAAEAIESLRNDGSLRTDVQREHAHRLLTALAAEPIRSSHAVFGLHRLQN